MGEVVDFPVKSRTTNSPGGPLEDDPYFRFIRNVLLTADAYGLEMPFSVESAAEHVYQQTRHKSQLAKMFAQAEEER